MSAVFKSFFGRSSVILVSFVLIAACGIRKPSPGHISRPLVDLSRNKISPQDASQLAASAATLLNANYKAAQVLVEGGQPECHDAAKVKSFTAALRKIRGEGQACLTLAKRCFAEHKNDPAAGSILAAEGARCAQIENKFDEAFELFDTALSLGSAETKPSLAYEFATFAFSTQYSSKVTEILARVGTWDAQSKAKIADVIESFSSGKGHLLNADEMEAFVTHEVASNALGLKVSFVNDWFENLVNNAYRQSDALIFAKKHLNSDTLFKCSVLYAALYVQKENGLINARAVYAAVAPYAHKGFNFPLESNSYTYTELYADACKSTLLQGDAYDSYKTISKNWQGGVISLDEAKIQAQKLLLQTGEKSDILSLMGGLAEASEDDSAAQAYYMRAHKACHFYERAHWGLFNIEKRLQALAYSDFDANLQRIDSELEGITFPPSFSSYVINFNGLTSIALKRLQYSLRFWAPYVDFLISSKSSLFVKQGYQLLSEAPGLEGIRDLRITYEADNRLWDDVRGVGGPTVIVDFSEMMGSAFGRYNLGGHEVAHQFHTALAEPQKKCIARLYAAAKARDLFADPYAGSNEQEYFAQGVAYYMVSPESPKRFGLTRTWIEQNDPKLFSFLQDIAAAKSAPNDLSCPIAE